MKVLTIVAVLLSVTVVVTNTEPVAAPQGGVEAILQGVVDLVDRLLTENLNDIFGTQTVASSSSRSILTRLLAELLAPILIATLGPLLTLTIDLNGLISLLNNLLPTYNGPNRSILTLFVELLVTFT